MIDQLGTKTWQARTAGLTLGCAVLVAAGTSGWAAGSTERVSVSTAGTQGNAASGFALLRDLGIGMSADGRYVAFQSFATNLVPGDTNRMPDIFVRDLRAGTTERVSVRSDGGQTVRDQVFTTNARPAISADGRMVAFVSSARNLVAGDTNHADDVFLHDRLTGTTSRVSLGTGGTQANAASDAPALSTGGRFVAFVSVASNLVAGDTNATEDVFVRDRVRGTTERVSVGTGGTQANAASGGPAISANGRFVAFSSFAGNLVPGDTNGTADVFVRDRVARTTTRVSVASNGAQAACTPDGPDPGGMATATAISADGRFVAFLSACANLVQGDTNGAIDVFVRDRQRATTERVSLGQGGRQANARSGVPAISPDGRFVAFSSQATNLVPNDTNRRDDVFLRDRLTGRTERVSLGVGDVQGNRSSYSPALSADGGRVAFASGATNLVPGDTNGHDDVFVRTR